jgi:UDP-glucose 4-epimerase
MKILVTGSAGRVGRAIYINLMKSHCVVGLDKTPCSTADIVGDICDLNVIRQALNGVDVIVHTAVLHAPHVGLVSDDAFTRINVDATEQLALEGIKAGVKHFVFTSTTALYGYASTRNGETAWINEAVTPKPKSIYHTSKIAAEARLQAISNLFKLPVTVLQMSRCFPEPADLMAVYRLTRGIDPRDVATAHLCAIEKRLSGFNRFIISGQTPFSPADCNALYKNADLLITQKCPKLADAFAERSWSLPTSLDRVYDASAAQKALGFSTQYGFEAVLAMLDAEVAEVLPVSKHDH